MDPTVIAAIITAVLGAVATMTAAYIGRTTGIKKGRAVGIIEGDANARRSFEQRVEAAPIEYVSELDKLISSGARQGLARARISARAIVSARNNLRNSLETISSSLNSDIDRLSEELESANTTPEALMDTIETLLRVWPSKKRQIQVEVRKALTEMGLLEQRLQKTEDRQRPQGGGQQQSY